MSTTTVPAEVIIKTSNSPAGAWMAHVCDRLTRERHTRWGVAAEYFLELVLNGTDGLFLGS